MTCMALIAVNPFLYLYLLWRNNILKEETILMITGSVFQCSMLFSIPWSIAAVVDNDGRQKFDTFYKELLGGKIESSPVPKSVGKFEVPMPDAMSCYDVFFEVIIISKV